MDDGELSEALLACSLCGLMVRPPGLWSRDEKWLAEAELLSDPDEEFEQREVHYRAGKLQGAAAFAMLEGPPAAIRRDAAFGLTCTRYLVVADNREVRPNWGARFDADHVPVSQPYSIVVHAACADIAARVARRPRPGVRLHSLRTLWKVLRTRFDARDNVCMTSNGLVPPVLVHNEDYYLRKSSSPPRWAERPSCSPLAVADPLNVPELTRKLLPNVGPMDGQPPSDTEKDFQTRFQRLPAELRVKVASYMFGPEGLPVACTRLLYPLAWMDFLLQPELLPFLWDLDANLVRAYDEYMRSQGLVPDWEKLVRTLSLKISCHSGGYWAMDVANGLRNRRRIWQLAEEMYVGDQLHLLFHAPGSSSTPPTMPKYWDEDGEPLHPVIRVPAYRGNWRVAPPDHPLLTALVF